MNTPRVPSVWIARDLGDSLAKATPVQRAMERLGMALTARGVVARMVEEAGSAMGLCIWVAGHEHPMARQILSRAGVDVPAAPEALGLVPGTRDGQRRILACGSDARGLAYALLELADRVEHAPDPIAALHISQPILERPANAVRSVCRFFTCEGEDKPWFTDRDFWRRYLALLMSQRFNRFSLALGLGYNRPSGIRDAYFYFPYPFFLVQVPGYSVRAVPLPNDEPARNLEMLRFISDEAAAVGLDFQLALWSHAYEYQNSPEATYRIEGLTPETHAPYCRDALRLLLEACPSITGITLRVHGESGIPEGSYDFWKTVFDGVAQCGRSVEIDMHAKGLEPRMMDIALATGLPVKISPKFWAEHMGLPYHQAAIRPHERPTEGPGREGFAFSTGSRRFLRYGYGDLLREDRPYGVIHRIWPGTQRVLLWGDPLFAAAYSRASSFCGSDGTEVCEPLSFKGRMGSGGPGPRDGYADPSLHPEGGDFEKYRYTYRIWGRLLYNPEADPDTWRRFLRQEYGAASEAVEQALAQASRILPLVTVAHHPSASNNTYWPELYTNMPFREALPHPYGDTPSPKRFGTVSPLDPQLFTSVDECAEELARNEKSGRYSPLDVADWLEEWANAAGRHLSEAEARAADATDPAFRRLAIDVATQADLGCFFAKKLRAGVLQSFYRLTGDRGALVAAVETYREAVAAWATLATRTRGVYVEDLTFGTQPHLRGHWADRLPALEADLADLEQQLRESESPSPDATPFTLPKPQEVPKVPLQHAPPSSFQRGEAISIRIAVGEERNLSVRLYFRRVNQAEEWRATDMVLHNGTFVAVIPADYTDSPFAIQYYFVVRLAPDCAWIYPGLGEDRTQQPYYVVRQANMP